MIILSSFTIFLSFQLGGKVTVDYWTTHVGHDDNALTLRSKHLSTSEKNMIVEKLKSGVPAEKILKDARKVKNQPLKRINVLNSKDIIYLSKKHNIEKTRDNNEVAGAALEVNDSNSVEDNFPFFFKPDGKMFSILFLNH